MKKLILMVSLLSPVHAFADVPCILSSRGSLPDWIIVNYNLRNESDYGISLKCDESEHGENPRDISSAVLVSSHLKNIIENHWSAAARSMLELRIRI